MRTLVLLSLLTVALSADTVTLKNGRIMNGTYLGGTAREVRLDMGDHVETIPVDGFPRCSSITPRLRRRIPSRSPDRAATSASGALQLRSFQDQSAACRWQRSAAPRSAAGRVGRDPGPDRELPHRSHDRQHGFPESPASGDQFRASIEDPVVINGQTVIPRGADVSVRLVDDKQSGKITGKTVLTLPSRPSR